jgi:hypothetical protein
VVLAGATMRKRSNPFKACGWHVAVYALTAATLLAVSGPADAADSQTISVEPGKNTDAYLEVNVSGTLYVAIHSAGGQPCANFWWIKWPFGNIENVGRKCGNASFKIPGIFDLAVIAKLRVGGAEQPLKVVVAANEQVAQSVSVKFP